MGKGNLLKLLRSLGAFTPPFPFASANVPYMYIGYTHARVRQ